MSSLHLVATAAPAPIATAELARRVAARAALVVDARPIAAYNGWRLAGERRGGHVPGAVALPADWLGGLDEPDLRTLLERKGVAGDRAIVIQGHGRDDPSIAAVVGRLAELEVGQLAIHAEGFAGWASDRSLPVERLRHHARLVHTDWLRAVLAAEPVEAPPARRFALFHVNFGGPEEYADGHLPGAFHLDTNWLEDPLDWNRRSPAALDESLRVLGIDRDTTVVLYGRDTEGGASEKWPGRRAGQIAATRALLILRYAGVDDVRLLDGGYDAWVRAGLPLESTPHRPAAVEWFGAPIPLRPQIIVDLEEAKEILADREGAALVSVRTWREHIGAVSGYNYIGPAGRIAGDVWGNCGSDAYHMQHYRNIDNTMRAYPEIAANWALAGITPEKRISFYCGTGWRASETWFYATLMGWPNVSVYDGGWLEWSRDPASNPIEVGEPDDEFAA